MTYDKCTIGLAQPTPPTICIKANDGRALLTIKPDGTVEGEIEDASEAARVFVDHIRKYIAEPQTDAIERALCEANGCVWDLDPDSDSRQQWRRDVATVTAALHQTTQSDAHRKAPIWTEAATIQTNGRWDGNIAQTDEPLSRWQKGFNSGVEEAAKALEADAMKCDCAALEERECACGAWCEWKSITSARAIEIVRAIKE
jgi:hypothetical protein